MYNIRITKTQNNMLKHFFKKNKVALIAAAVLLASSVILVQTNLVEFQADVVSKKAAPFDGLVPPVKEIPNWVKLDTTEWDLPFNSIPQNKKIPLPEYDSADLVVPFKSLNFSKDREIAIRNAQVTYSVPYMGNYKLDGREYVGSHLAIDIKIPNDTPIYAIGNGVVVKASNITTGFGKHVVIKHVDFPDYFTSKQNATYYSSYSHMGSLSVDEGDVVRKGEKIGLSGESGTATTPHLHFQIDNDKAPWHPYWPFTYAEASAAGYSFFDAINNGLGKDRAEETTIHPMLYVQKFMDDSVVVSQPEPVIVEDDEVNTDVRITDSNDELPPIGGSSNDEREVEETPAPTPEPEVVIALDEFSLDYPREFTVGEPIVVKVSALDENGNVIKNYSPGNIYLKLENGTADLETTILDADDFSNGKAEFEIMPKADFGIKFSITDGNVSKLSSVIKVADEPEVEIVEDPVAEEDKSSEEEVLEVKTIFSDVNENDDNFKAVAFLKNNEVINGYPDGSFRPGNPVSRVESLKFIYEGLNRDTVSGAEPGFGDTDKNAWYSKYVASAAKDGIVKGYDGNVFRPANAVTRAEFIKMLLETANVNVSDVKRRQPYNDVKLNDWHFEYMAKAKDLNLLDSRARNIEPNEALTREEVAEILYKMIVAKVNGRDRYSNSLVVDNSDVSRFFRN